MHTCMAARHAQDAERLAAEDVARRAEQEAAARRAEEETARQAASEAELRELRLILAGAAEMLEFGDDKTLRACQWKIAGGEVANFAPSSTATRTTWRC